MIRLLILTLLLLVTPSLFAQSTGIPAVTVIPNADGSQEYSVTLQVLALMTALSFIPAIVIMMTSFTRIVIVLSILRQAMGLQQAPSNQIIIGLSLFLSLFIMTPVMNKINDNALQPYLNEEISTTVALEQLQLPIREFMLSQTREKDIATFLEISDNDDVKDINDVPFLVLIPAFITSELKTAFQIGFMLFIPFLVLDLVVASVLMAMGMMMLSPMIVSLPFKLMLFVLVDGWSLVMGTLAMSFGLGS
ncbi:MAG: flagellar type III secretion system pore protein FliP [Gammaproteobacteria bacterium]|nr:flagellar type III secretion system pore protein FliP [Gammaproteobacteria bacterium]